jgi:hypothetical protein
MDRPNSFAAIRNSFVIIFKSHSASPSFTDRMTGSDLRFDVYQGWGGNGEIPQPTREV